MARQRFGKMHHLWKDNNLHQNLRLRLYKAAVCSILTYGSEAWMLNAEVRRALNGANASMLAIITGKTVHEESSDDTRTFDLVKWVRARRLQWLGHILRMGMERLLKRAVYGMFMLPQDGDLMMDAPTLNCSWRQLCKYAEDREYWRVLVRALKQPKVKQSRITVTINPHVRGAKITRKPKPIPRKKFAGLSPSKRAAKRYRDRDAHAAFFRPTTRSMTRAKRKRDQSRPNRRKRQYLTNKERAAWAREYYQQHHGTDDLTFSPPAILGHHKTKQSNTHPSNANATMTPLTAQELLHFYNNRSTDRGILQDLSNIHTNT